jgi:phosphonate transport system ATP-binding protein
MHLQLQNISALHPTSGRALAPPLHGITLQVQAGEQIAIIGPSGAGKTTLLHLIACALPPHMGTFRLDGKDPWQLAPKALKQLRGTLFLAPQLPPLPPRQRVVTAVLAARLPQESLWASLHSLIYPQDIARAEHALASFDLADKLFERVDRLSGGERQRVGLARALISNASLFLVDEPLSALDPSRSEQALTTLTAAAQQRKATLLTTLHHVPLALAHFPRILGLREGTLLFDLPANQVSQHHLQALYDNPKQTMQATLAPLAEDQPYPAPPPPVMMHCR